MKPSPTELRIQDARVSVLLLNSFLFSILHLNFNKKKNSRQNTHSKFIRENNEIIPFVLSQNFNLH